MNVLTNLNLLRNELQNAVIQPLAVAPSNPALGQIYYNTVDHLLYQYNGTQWAPVGAPYELPVATESTLGGVMVDGDTISVDVEGEISLNSTLKAKYDGYETELDGKEPAITAGSTSQYLRGDKSWQTLDKNAVGLSNVPNVTTNNQTPTFTQATTRANLVSGETLSTLFGKIMKWFSDLGAMAFKSTVEKTDLSSGVQASLDRADTALQTAPVTSVNTKTGAVVLDAGDVGALASSGGTLTGNLAMSTNKITGLGAGTSNTDAINKKQLDDAIAGLGTVFNLKGAKATIDDLPATGNRIGDVWFVEEVSAAYIWLTDTVSPDGRWEEFGEPIDLSGYLTKSDLAQGTGTATNNTMSQNAITIELNKKANITDLPGAIKVATGTIATSAKTATVAYSGTVLNTFVKDTNGVEVITDVTIGAASVTFTTAVNPTTALTCAVIYK